MTPEERLRELAEWFRVNETGRPWKGPACDAGATALAITREIAGAGTPWIDMEGLIDPVCRLCYAQWPDHESDCLYLRCVQLHQGEKP
jgi:hypothetical protein